MSDQFVKVVHTGFLRRMANSIFGVLFGILLFFGSFVVLWMNEGRIDYSAVAAPSQVANADRVDPATDGKYVSITGALTASEAVGDDPYLNPGPYVRLERNVEMYAWVQESSSETTSNTGGSSTTKTTYTYKQQWTSSPADSSNFEVPQGHSNPSMAIQSETRLAPSATLAAYQVDIQTLEIPDGKALPLTRTIVRLGDESQLVDNYIYSGTGTPGTPKIGDLRISYTALASGERVTAFGVQKGGQLTPYMYRGETQFYRALSGDRTTAIATLRSEYVTLGWILRIVGFFMMWIGLMLCFNPISTFLDILPIAGKASGCLISGASAGAALVLTTITVIIAVIAHNVFLLAILLALIIGGAAFWGKMAKNKMQPQ